MDENSKLLTSALTPVMADISELIKKVAICNEAMLTTATKLKNTLNYLSENLPIAIVELAKNGWYISWNTIPGRITFCANELKKGNFVQVDEELCEQLDNDLDHIQYILTNNFPHRSKIINSAIFAHKSRMFYLSTPVFMTQIEGICSEITGNRYFSMKQGIPKTRKWVDQFASDTFIGMLLQPLTRMDLPRQVQIPGKPIGLNRHDVLHGDSLDYGENKINSYKTLSLLSYLGDIVFEANKKSNQSEIDCA